MHIDRTHQSHKAAGAAGPNSSLGLVFMPTCRTLARGSSFGASEAHDVSRFGLVREIILVFTIFPQGHALVVMPPCILGANAMRITDEESSDLLLDAEIDHLARGFVPLVTNAALGTSALLVLGALQLLPAPGILGAAGLLLGNLAKVLTPLSFERADAASGDDHRLARVGGHSSQVNLAQIHRRLHVARRFCCEWDFYADMQLEAIIPDEATGSAVFG